MSTFKDLDIYKNFLESKRRVTKATNYFHIYEELFSKYKGKDITFVEIGVKWGGSLQMWRKFFGKNARIIGIDLFEKTKKMEEEGFEIFIGDQSSKKFWENFFDKVGKVDIILDDGGHTNENQIVTLNCCLNYINDGGLLVVEDAGSSYLEKFGGPHRFSFISYCKFLVDDINMRSKIGKEDIQSKHKKEKSLNQLIYSIKFFTNCVAFFIEKTKNIESEQIANIEIDPMKDIIDDETFKNPRWKSKIYQNAIVSERNKILFSKIISFVKKVNILHKIASKLNQYIINKKIKNKLQKYFK